MPPQAQTPSSVMPIYTSPQQTNSNVAQYASVSTGPSIEQSPSSQIPLFSTQQYQSNSSMAFDSSKTTVVKKRVPVTYQATVQWEKHVYPAQDVKETVQQPIYLIQEIPNFPLRKTTVEPEKKPEPIRERARPERSAPPPKPETIYKDKYNIVEVTREVVKVVEKRVDVPIEKIIYQDKVVPVEKQVVQENIKHVNVPVDRVVEKKVPVERVVERIVEVPRERIIEVPFERIIEVPVEKIVEMQIPVERRVEVPVDRVVEVPVEREIEEVVLIESEPVFETRQRRVQVPVTIMQEQVIEEQIEVGYRHHAVQEPQRVVASDRYSQQQYQSRNVQYVEQRPAEQQIAYATQYPRQYGSPTGQSYATNYPTSSYGVTSHGAASYGATSVLSRPPYTSQTDGDRVYSRTSYGGQGAGGQVYGGGYASSPNSSVRTLGSSVATGQTGQRLSGVTYAAGSSQPSSQGGRLAGRF